MLYGDIRVNDDVLATWSARRLVRPPNTTGANPYEITVTYQAPDGAVHSIAGRLDHTYGDGALVLASEVTAWAAEQVKQRENITNQEGASS